MCKGEYGSAGATEACTPVEDEGNVMADLEKALHFNEGAQVRQPTIHRMPTNEHEGSTKLFPTFGYAGSLDKEAPFAKFDIRDDACLRAGGFKHGQEVRDRSGNELVVVGVKLCERRPRLWFQPKKLGRPGAGVFWGLSAADLQQQLSPVASHARSTLREARLGDFNALEEADGEEVWLCSECRLPVGDSVCCGDDSAGEPKRHMHSECKAQLWLRSANAAEESRVDRDAESKQRDRVEYDIGWRVERSPGNVGLAAKLGFDLEPRELCCVVLQEDAQHVKIDATTEPTAAINLEYLSVALQVRAREGREPVFSLDPVDPTDRNSMQKKVFVPSWLAGTSVGEVLFQADYHLKELSMGAHKQPIIGMKSCLDYFEEECHREGWNAREWFVVRQADVLMTEDDVLIPSVQMGVEAREQKEICGGIVDAVMTRSDHPLVKYANEFTHKFDLIAERKSVIYHLRELAKASVLAKFLLDSEITLDEAWWSVDTNAKKLSSSQVPQLWNERYHGRVELQDGEIVSNGKRMDRQRNNGVYGGVDLGLDRARLSAMRADSIRQGGRVPGYGLNLGSLAFQSPSQKLQPVKQTGQFLNQPMSAWGQAVFKYEIEKQARAAMAPPPESAPAAAAGPVVKRDIVPMAPVRAARGGRRGGRMPRQRVMAQPTGNIQQPAVVGRRATRDAARGVDLNLDQFDLSEPTRMTSQRTAGSWDSILESETPVSDAFWSAITSDVDSKVEGKDKSLLRGIFNPHLSDRRDEGDNFVPPSTESTHVEKLRKLVREEETAQSSRRDRFFSKDFSAGEPGSLFPSSWTPAYKIARKESSTTAQELSPRPEFATQVTTLLHVMKSSTPTFDKCTEDGMRFRIYRKGSIEVRTTQEHDAEEVIGVVFSVGCEQSQGIADDEKVVAATEYVETLCDDARKDAAWGYYIVFRTECGNTIATQLLHDGGVAWELNPSNLDERNARASVVRASDCHNAAEDIRVGAVKGDLTEEHSCTGKRYVQRAYSRVCGESQGSKAAKVPRKRRLDKYFEFKAQQNQHGKSNRAQ